ncbi:hypothetical protein RR48_04083 [Papilio machaon]|uniref:Uncharacterized protein n=1 Tax=Papilio machaon TaxID=76193 RepID=A0A0N1IBD6_PAPMA|nr:hypothetical protein RR48_04083 [Papilio machaon]
MGSGASGLAGEVPGSDLRLPVSGLRFSLHQLRALNSYLDILYEEDQKGRITTEMECIVEGIVQRIVDGAGQRDPRFRCCHLIALHRNKKVVERWVQLLARCARGKGGGTSRVLSARAAAYARPQRYCYLETVSQQKSCERRLAIVEGAAWVLVRVGAAQAEAKLMLCARAAGCSSAAARVPLTHPMALLHYTAAQEGYYAAAVGPPGSSAGGERGALWQLWQPALEAALDAHCSDLSTLARVAGALNTLVDNMREGSYQGSTRLLSRYMAWCALRRRLHRVSQLHSVAARSFAAAHASHHLLLVLDSLVQTCERGGLAGFVFPMERASLTRRGARDGEWAPDAVCIRNCLLHLQKLAVGEEIQRSPSEILESALFSRWESVNRESKSSLAANSYSPRQLRYLSRVANELIKCKNMMAYENENAFKANLIQATSQHQESIEELVHVLAIALDQARDAYLNNFQCRNSGEFDKELSVYRSKKWNKLKDYYDASSACLIDAARRDPELRKEDLSDTNLMKHVLLWLHKGVKEDKKYLGPVLKPYLDGLFDVSIENCWFLEEFDARKCEVERRGLEEYCLGVHSGEIEPCMGLLDAAKTMSWAKAMVDFVDRFRHIEKLEIIERGSKAKVGSLSYPVTMYSHYSLAIPSFQYGVWQCSSSVL